MIEGNCHCGNVSIAIPALTETGTSCTCSVCARYAAIWGYFTEQQVVIRIGDSGTNQYCHGDKQIVFNSCAHCSCVTHYSSTTPAPDARLAVNYRMFDAKTTNSLNIRVFDGADTWEYLD